MNASNTIATNANSYNLVSVIARNAVRAGLDLNSAYLGDLFIDAQTLPEHVNAEGVVFLAVSFSGCTHRISRGTAFDLKIIDIRDKYRTAAIYRVDRNSRNVDDLPSYTITRVTADDVDQFIGR